MQHVQNEKELASFQSKKHLRNNNVSEVIFLPFELNEIYIHMKLDELFVFPCLSNSLS